MKGMIKNFLKDKFLILKIRNKFNPSVQIGQRQLYHYYKELSKKNELISISETGFNFIFVKNGIADMQLPEVSVESVLNHVSVKEAYKTFEPIKNWDYIKG